MSDRRNLGIDLTRIVAFCCVPAIHFFINAGIYESTVDCNRMYMMVFARTFFRICVPLFLMITGYLMSEKAVAIDRKGLLSFYSRLTKVVILYVISEIVLLFMLAGYSGEPLTIKDAVFKILSFNVGYEWYVEMYIGLFLMIPFLNLIWSHCAEKNQRLAVVVVFLLITTTYSIVNIFSLSSIDFVFHPWKSEEYTKLLPAWWNNLYPVSYYFIGAYIKKDVDASKINTLKLAVLLCICITIFSVFNIWRCYSVPFIWGPWQEWGSAENVVDSTLVFLLINSINYEKVPAVISRVLGRISGLTFSAFILSKGVDVILYSELNKSVPQVLMRLNYFPVMVGSVITISLLLSAIVQMIYRLITATYRSLL